MLWLCGCGKWGLPRRGAESRCPLRQVGSTTGHQGSSAIEICSVSPNLVYIINVKFSKLMLCEILSEEFVSEFYADTVFDRLSDVCTNVSEGDSSSEYSSVQMM